MTEDDKKAFAETWRAALATYGREATREMLAIAFAVLRRFTLQQVQDGVTEHMNRSKFAPTPADIVAAIESRNPDGRLGADEAWALAITASDENETVVWTTEIAEAFGAAKPVLDAGDKVGARMAFRASYERLVEDARRSAAPAVWQVSLGFDTDKREAVLMKAVERRLLPLSKVQHLLQAPDTEKGAAIAGLLTGKVTETSDKAFNVRLRELRDSIVASQERAEQERIAQVEAALAEDRERKEAVSKAVSEWESNHQEATV